MRCSLAITFPKWVWSFPQSNPYQEIKEHKQIKGINDQWDNLIVNSTSYKKGNVVFTYNPLSRKKDIQNNSKISDYITSTIPYHYFSEDKYINRRHQNVVDFTNTYLPQSKSLILIIQSLYNAVLDYLIYDNPIPGLYTFTDSLGKRRVDCGGFSTLLSSCLQAAGIPTRLVVGYVLKKQSFIKHIFLNTRFQQMTFNDVSMHAWLEALLPDNSWFPLDPSIEWRRNHGLTKRQGGFGFIPADRLIVSYGHNHTVQFGNQTLHFPLIQDPIKV